MAADYTIVAQNQTTDLTAAGQFVDVVAVTFTTRHGDSGTIRIPLAEYTAEHVAQVVGARVAQLIAVRAL